MTWPNFLNTLRPVSCSFLLDVFGLHYLHLISFFVAGTNMFYLFLGDFLQLLSVLIGATVIYFFEFDLGALLYISIAGFVDRRLHFLL